MNVVGRVAALGEIDRALDRAFSGFGGVLVFHGPTGAGKTTVLDAGCERAITRGAHVLRTSPPTGSGRLVWAQLVRDIAGDGAVPRQMLDKYDVLELDAAARLLASLEPRTIAVDDVDRGGPDCMAFLEVLAARVAGSPTVVVVTSAQPLSIGTAVALGPLTEHDFGALLEGLPAETRRAIWVASEGWPGRARSFATELAGLPAGQDPLAHIALSASRRTHFLAVDGTIVRLLELALEHAGDDATRARLLARLAAELLGDLSAADRRRSLSDQALELARRAGDAQALADVLDSRLQALWDPAGAEDRLAAGSEIIDLARAAGDRARERHGLFWRFVALMELGRVAEAESALAAFEREVDLAGDAKAAVMVLARRCMLSTLRGRFDEAGRFAGRVADEARRVGLADAKQIVDAVRVAIYAERDLPALIEMLPQERQAAASWAPGQFFEAVGARFLSLAGRIDEASLEFEGVLPRVLDGSGPRRLGALADLAVVAAATGNVPAAQAIYVEMLPYRGRMVVLGGAATLWGPVSHYLGLLASTLCRPADAVGFFEEAIEMEESIGALPDLARSLDRLASALTARGAPGDVEAAAAHRRRARSIAERLGMTVLLSELTPPADEWTLAHEGDDWVLSAGEEQARLRDARGLHYLRMLVATPGRDVPALDLVAGGVGMVAPSAQPVLDDAARSAYRRRLAELDAELDAADASGDVAGAQRAQRDRDALVNELRRSTGLGGRPRRTSAEAERARINVTRTLRATIDRLERVAPMTAAHLRASVRTGLACRYEPAPGGPTRWRV